MKECQTKQTERTEMFKNKPKTIKYNAIYLNRLSYKERKGNALASGAEEGRDKLR